MRSLKIKGGPLNYSRLLVILVLVCVYIIPGEIMAGETKRRIVLLGASVGKGWQIERLPARANNDEYIFEYAGVYSFDKTQALHSLLGREEGTRPGAIILKECAAYFPGELSHYKKLILQWIADCEARGVIPIPATVVPVARSDAFVDQAKDFIKVSLLGRQTRIEAIIEYNDWIRQMAQEKGLIVLDLEAALRVSDKDRHLRADLHSGDGLHLNEKAYTILDTIVYPTLDKLWYDKK